MSSFPLFVGTATLSSVPTGGEFSKAPELCVGGWSFIQSIMKSMPPLADRMCVGDLGCKATEAPVFLPFDFGLPWAGAL